VTADTCDTCSRSYKVKYSRRERLFAIMTVSQKGMMPIDDGDETTINIQNYRCNKIYRGEIDIRI